MDYPEKSSYSPPKILTPFPTALAFDNKNIVGGLEI